MRLRSPSPLRAGPLFRPRIVELLHGKAKVVALAAPAGYGKSTALRSLRAGQPPLRYVPFNAAIEDASELLFRVRKALDTDAPYVLAVDGIGAASPRLLMSLFLHVHSAPEGSRLLLSSRRPIDWDDALDVAPSEVQHVGPAELAFTPDEASDVLVAAGVDIGVVDSGRLLQRTRGWPIAQYLCALLLREASQPAGVVEHLVNDDGELLRRLVAGLVSQLSAADRRFLTRTSVLQTMSGPLCDWMLDTHGSDRHLSALAESNLLVVPVDDHIGTYRYQRLFAELLRAELNDRRPDAVAYLHLRAGEWFADHGDDEVAHWHRQAAHTAARTEAAAPPGARSGRGGAPDLSLADMQVLAFLPSHLSFGEIGLRLGRSGPAIQRLAIGIYRKLGVVSRRDAVERGLVLGLVAHDKLSFRT